MRLGRHRTLSDWRPRALPVRRSIAAPIAGVVVAATMLGGPMLVAAGPGDTAVPDVPALPSPAPAVEDRALGLSAHVARDEAQASRGQVRTTPSPSATPEPSATPSAPASPAPEPEPTPEPPPAPPAVVGEHWATQDVNVRSGPGAGTDRIGFLGALDQVGVTGTTENGWTQVVIDDRAGWVKGSYLSETKPEPAPKPAPEPAPAPKSEPKPEPKSEPEAAPAPASDASCSISSDIESNLTSNARAVYRAVCAAYGGSVSSFGGYRPGDGGDHGSGRAVDIMVSGPIGWDISRFLQSRAGELGITYVIYEQKIWMAGSSHGDWEWMEDRGGATANHFDHVHVSVS